MRRASKISYLWLVLTLLCVGFPVFAGETDDDRVDFENDRVARITIIRGDVQVRRAGSQEWEEAAPNLPLIEGDRIATGQDARVEIQFDRDNYLRLAEDSILKIVTLNETGVALSLPEGALSLRLGDFDKKGNYFEIDAPDTTIAFEKEGLYRIDAPVGNREGEIRVSVFGGGLARVYTQDSGYAVRNGRSARIFLTGDYAGDIDYTAAASFDNFDEWIASREEAVDRRRRDDYRGYYDRSIYGADDLNEYGEWANSRDYGWVWRPSYNATSAYDNWSPYRHGHWRHLPNHGWTWIAAEPWGWATSHYGRWVWVDNYWSWSPYDHGRRASYRSRWSPALVVFINYGNNICWHPLPYGHGYSRNRGNRRTIIYNTTIINNYPANNPTPTPTPRFGNGSEVPVRGVDELLRASNVSREQYIKAMSGMPANQFGVKKEKAVTAISPAEAKGAINSFNMMKGEKKIVLPEFTGKTETKIERGREITAKRDSLKQAERILETGEKIGAVQRTKDRASDEKLLQDRVDRGRMKNEGEPPNQKNSEERQPRTGVFERSTEQRPERKRSDDLDRPGRRLPPVENEKSDTDARDEQIKNEQREQKRRETQQRDDQDRQNQQRDEQTKNQQRREEQIREENQRRENQQREENQRRENQQREQQRQRDEPPRYNPPPQQREEKRPDPPREEKRSDPPPSNNNTKNEKDGRK